MQVIGPFRLNPTQGTQPQSRVSQPAGKDSAAAPKPQTVDQLDISPEARAASESSSPATVGGDIRLDKVADIRRQIAEGTYDTDEKLDAALNRMMDQLY